MVKAHKSRLCPQHSVRQSPDLNCMSTSLDPRQPGCLPSSINRGNYMVSAKVPLPGPAATGLANLKTEQTNGEQTNGAHKLLHVLPPHIHTLVSNTNPYLNEKQPAVPCGLSGKATPNMTLGSLQNGLVVFDRSGSQTHLIYSSFCPSVLNPLATLRKQVSDHVFLEELPNKTDQFTSGKHIFHEESDENHISGKEFEMHEDTDEINALLYSDEDDDYSDDDDEVKSTDHFPVSIDGNYEKHEQIGETSEEIASSDGPNKRQKLLHGGYNKSSQTGTCSVQLDGPHECDNDAESSHASGNTRRKDKIDSTLRILQGIIPGGNGKDPLSILDEAIDYLQSLKLKAVALGL